MNGNERIPVFARRLGSVRLAIWQNDAVTGPRFSVGVQRSYRDSNGTWQRTANMNAEDLPVVRRLLYDAESWILDQSDISRTHERRAISADANHVSNGPNVEPGGAP